MNNHRGELGQVPPPIPISPAGRVSRPPSRSPDQSSQVGTSHLSNDPDTHEDWARTNTILDDPFQLIDRFYGAFVSTLPPFQALAMSRTRERLLERINRIDADDPSRHDFRPLHEDDPNVFGALLFDFDNRASTSVELRMVLGVLNSRNLSEDVQNPGLNSRLRWFSQTAFLLHSLKQLERHVARGHLPLLFAPSGAAPRELDPRLDPGMRLNTFRYEWTMRRLWLRLLHLPSWAEPDPDWDGRGDMWLNKGMQYDMASFYAMGKALLLDERERLRPDGDSYQKLTENDDRDADNIKWLLEIRSKLFIALKDSIRSAIDPDPSVQRKDWRQKVAEFNAKREAARGATKRKSAEAVDESAGQPDIKKPKTDAQDNVRPDNQGIDQQPQEDRTEDWEAMHDKVKSRMSTNIISFLSDIRRIFEEKMAAHPLDWLVLDLLRREDIFEEFLSHEHVEDRLICKQIVLHDDEKLAHHPEWTLGPDEWVGMMSAWYTQSHRAERYTRELFTDTALISRQRRNFRLMREWNGGRPWKQIYQYYDTSDPENSWRKDAIATFYSNIAFSQNPSLEFDLSGMSLRDSTAIPRGAHSSLKSITKHILGFHPIDYTNSPTLHSQACQLCQKPMAGGEGYGSTIVELRCSDTHRFHLKCIFRYWDVPNNYMHKCPTCGSSAPLAHIAAQLSNDRGNPSFVENVHGYRRGKKLSDPDFLSGYNPSNEHLDHENMLYGAGAREMRGPIWWGQRKFQVDEEGNVDFSNVPRTGRGLRSTDMRGGRRAFLYGESVETFAKRIGGMWVLRNEDAAEETRQDVLQEAQPEHWLDGARLSDPMMEEVMIREHRFRREGRKRRQIRSEGKGLESLPE